MTDQQTSRTNITEALRRLIAYVEQWGEGNDASEIALLDEARRALNATNGYDTERDPLNLVGDHDRAALATEPHSDAVTAPDEPSTEEGRGLLKAMRFHFPDERADEWRKQIVAIEREAAANENRRVTRTLWEARAASASVPPLDVERLPLGARLTLQRGDDYGSGAPWYAIVENTIELPGQDTGRLGSGLTAREAFDDAVRAYAAETPERGSSQRSDRKNLSTYQAETPEQGRGDE